jgi:VIT1/CCC1 family predicted Fe2+/Mn2+ transporter
MLTGGVVAVLSGWPPQRQLGIGAAAAAVTYLLGMALDAAIG